jgi:putative FmdB family regulatory protein
VARPVVVDTEVDGAAACADHWHLSCIRSGYTYAPVFGGKMPIYEYRCSACGHELEVLQKISAEPLVNCPSCGKATLTKLVSAAGFQLKGSGWYVTDFRDGDKSRKAKSESKSKGGDTADSAAATKADNSGDGAAASKKDDTKSTDTTKTGTKSGASSDSTGK